MKKVTDLRKLFPRHQGNTFPKASHPKKLLVQSSSPGACWGLASVGETQMSGCLRLTLDIYALLPFIWDAANGSSPSFLVLRVCACERRLLGRFGNCMNDQFDGAKSKRENAHLRLGAPERRLLPLFRHVDVSYRQAIFEPLSSL